MDERMQSMHSQVDWMKKFRETGILWKHDGDTKKPHVICGKLKHSATYMNVQRLLERPKLLSQASDSLVQDLKASGAMLDSIDRVIGFSVNGHVLAHAIARAITAARADFITECLFSFVDERAFKGGNEKSLHVAHISRGESILLVDTRCCFGRSFKFGVDILKRFGATPVNALCCVARYCDTSPISGMQLHSLVNLSSDEQDVSDCDLCAQGSPAIFPNDGKNWQLLTGSA